MRENLTLRERHRLPWKLDHPIFVTTKHQKEPTEFLWTTRLRPQVRHVVVSMDTQNFNRPLSLPFPSLVISEVEVLVTVSDLTCLHPVYCYIGRPAAD